MKYMIEEAIFVETSAFLKFFIEGVSVFEKIEKYELYTSTNVIEEVCYVLLKEKAQKILKEDRHYAVLTFLRKNQSFVIELSKEIIEDIETLLNALNIKVLTSPPKEIMYEIIVKYGLLPNDALIVATCKYYDIRKIATFDEDFEKVDFVEVVKV